MTSQINKVSKRGFRVYELISTSYHEAGHTVIALLSSFKVYSVYVFEHKIYKRIHGFTHYQSPDLDIEHLMFNQMLEQEIGLSYAGLLAEKHHFKSISGIDQVPMFIKEGSSDDITEVRKMIQKYNPIPAGKKREAYKRKISRKTLKTLIEHWDAVDLVAHALFKHKKLSFNDLKELLTKKSKNKDFWKEQFKVIVQTYGND